MAKLADIEAGCELAYRKALADHGQGRVSRQDLLVAGRSLGRTDRETDLDRIAHTPAGQDPDVIIVLSRPLNRRNGAQ